MNAMKCAMMQPAFMPWMGFFELICRADTFIILDDFQFSVQSYHQRNRLFLNHGQPGWYSVPVMKSVSFKSPLNQTLIDESSRWRDKMWKRIQYNYAKAPYYCEIGPRIKEWLLKPAKSLAEQNTALILMLCDIFGYQRRIVFSSALPSSKGSSERVVELLRWCEATQYLCAKGSFDYMLEEGVFPLKDIEVLFQNFRLQSYEQAAAQGAFVPFLSVLDALMNIGPKRTTVLIDNGTKEWLSWGEMIRMKSVSQTGVGGI